MKKINVAVLTEFRAFALVFRPHPIWGKKKMLIPRGQPDGGRGGWAHVELTDAWTINLHVYRKMLIKYRFTNKTGLRT